MTVSLGTQQDIREMDARGVPRAQISRELGVSRNTVAKYADMGDVSPAAPVSERRPWPATEAYRGWIDGVLEEDLGTPRQVEFLLGYLEAEAASRDASKRASLLRRCALPAPKTFVCSVK